MKTGEISNLQAEAAGALGTYIVDRFDRRTMKISFPSFKRVLVLSLEFILWTTITGFCCWGVAWLVTEAMFWLM